MQKQTWLTSTPVPPHPGLWCPGLMMPTDITWQLVSDVFKEQADAVSEFHSINISIIAKEKQIMKVEITITILARNFLCSVPSKSIRGVRVVNFRASHTVDSPHDDDDVVNNDFHARSFAVPGEKTLPFSKDKDKFSLCIWLCLC